MNELCLVWGPPLSGQWRWMCQCASETDPSIESSIVLFDRDEAPSTDLVLKELDSVCSRVSTSKRQIYCELPWEAALENFEFEMQPDWNLSFVALCPFDAERLPDHYRRGLEEFARFSNSSVLVLSSEGNQELPPWLGTDILDFGPRLEVFEEPIWSMNSLVPRKDHYFTHVETFDNHCVSAALGEKGRRDLFKRLIDGDFGSIWGAELCWKESAHEVGVLTLTQGQLFEWRSQHRCLLDKARLARDRLRVYGFPIRKGELLNQIGRLT